MNSHKALPHVRAIHRRHSMTSSTGNNSETESWETIWVTPPSGEMYVPNTQATEFQLHFPEPSLRNADANPDPSMKRGSLDELPSAFIYATQCGTIVRRVARPTTCSITRKAAVIVEVYS